VADDLVAQVANRFVDHLRNLLPGVGLLHRKRQAHDEKERDKKARNEHFPRQCAVHQRGLLSCFRRFDADRFIKLDQHTPKNEVQKMYQRNCLQHKNLGLSMVRCEASKK